MDHYKLEVRNIEKSFPGVKALDKINFAVRPGTVHVLCGENGAGKSTLMKIINGVYQPDAGQILIDGKEVEIKNPIQARAHGISMIFQELNFVPEMTIEESFVLGNWPTNKLGVVDWKAVRQKAQALLDSEGLKYDLHQKIKELSVSECQMLEILKAISYNSSIIIMDEPTSAISNKEVESLFHRINSLKKKGISIIYISHKMEEIFRIADDITILRDGTVVDSKPASELTIEKVINMMVGREFDSSKYPKEIIPLGEELIKVTNFTQDGVFKDINFSAHAGEIVGFAGLMGAGRTEVARALFGLDPYTSGELKLSGKKADITTVGNSIKNGLAMLSEDRRKFGIIPIRSVKENITLASLKEDFFNGYLHRDSERTRVEQIKKEMNIKTPSSETAIEALSGGNQQKVILAKWILSNPKVLILDEPTRGIDVGAKFEIYKLMMQIVKSGKAIIMISSELPELIGMCDKIYVMAEGNIQGELQRKDFSQAKIMEYATKVKCDVVKEESKDE